MFEQPQYQPPAFTGLWNDQQPEQSEYNLDAAGRNYRVTELQTVLFPTVVDQIIIDPASLVIPGGFFSRGGTFQTQPITLDVQPLPAGIPADFQGAVGDFSIQASVDTTSTKVNDTLTLNVIISGAGNLDNLADPVWTEGPEWRAFDSKANVSTQFADGRLVGTRSYERVLVPTEAGQLTIPPIYFSFFNPETAVYQTISTQPIVINVAPDGSGTIVPPAAPVGNIGAVGPTVPNTTVGIQPLKPSSEAGGSSPALLTNSAVYWLLWGVPLALLAGHFGLKQVQQQQQNTAVARRSSQAAKKAHQALRKANKTDDADEAAGRILADYIATKLDRSIAGLTHVELAGLLTAKEIDPALVERTQNCLTRSEMGRYAPVGINTANNDLLTDAGKVIDELEKEI